MHADKGRMGTKHQSTCIAIESYALTLAESARARVITETLPFPRWAAILISGSIIAAIIAASMSEAESCKVVYRGEGKQVSILLEAPMKQSLFDQFV